LTIFPGSNTSCSCEIVSADLANIETLQNSAAVILKRGIKLDVNAKNVYERVIFINNAGSLGPLVPVGTSNSATKLQALCDSMNFNVVSSSYLTAELMSIYKTSRLSADYLTIVNVSSLAALQPFESWALYCSGKAAREMFHKVLAVENEKDTCLSVLNYAPGPLDTDMSREIRESPTLGQDSKDYFQSLKDDNKLVQVKDSAAKLVKLVIMNKFVSGSHIDYFDHIEGVDDFPTGDASITTGNPATDTNKDKNRIATTKGACSSCGCTAECGPACKCSVVTAKVAEGCSSCGCTAECGPACKCSVVAAKVAEGCSSCGCTAECGPACKCSVVAAKVAEGCSSCGCTAECGPACKCSVVAAKVAEGCSSCGCTAECGPACKCSVAAVTVADENLFMNVNSQ
jgi:sepiapterin reductase